MIATGLAEAATARGKKTIFLDMDTPVGDALRVFGISDPGPYPTLSSLKVYHDPWKHSIRSKSGTFILPKPENPQDIITRSDAQKLIKECRGFDLIIADLGSDFSQPAWSLFVEKADLRLLVVDCDEKAVVRVREFLSKTSDQYDWTLVINQREEKGYYTPRQITRMLKDETIVKTVITAPYIKYITERQPQTFSPDHIFAKGILDSVWAFNAIIHTPSRPSTEPPDAPTSETVSTADSEPKILDEIINTTSPSSTESENVSIKKRETPEKTDKMPVLISEKQRKEVKPFKLMLFTKTGILVDNKFIKLRFSEPDDITVDYDAIVIPASKGVPMVKKFRRKNPMTPIVVLKGNKSFIAAGADKCVSKITSSVIEEVYSLISRLQELWARVETDPLTGLYTRRFLNEWMQEREQRNKYYSAVILDIDKFKNVNDIYGHDAGDAVLAALGSFLTAETRVADVVARYGGEEFVICLPDTTASEAHYLIDRLRQKWSQRVVTVPNSGNIQTTFSAGVAEWYPGADILKSADKMLYQAKETGRNKVCMETKPNVLLLGVQGIDNRINLVSDPKEANFVITNTRNIKYTTDKYPVYCIGTGSVSDWSVKQSHPTAVMCSSFEDAADKILAPKDFFIDERPKLTVLPGARGSSKGITVPDNGALYVVCPSRPAQAGEVSAKLVFDNTALVCATPESTAALSLGIPKEELIDTDWRIPGAKAPIQYGKITVWPVDPYKHLNVPVNVHSLVDQIKSRFSLVIVDCGASLDICSRIARDEGVLVLAREGDKSDIATQHWLENYGGLNVTVFSPAEIPNILSAENGFILSKVSVAAER